MINTVSKIIKITNLKKQYNQTLAVKGIDLEIKEGEIFGIIGPDGAGKTSIFKMLAGVMPATEGNMNFFGNDVQDARREIGFLTQQFSFYEDLTVDENIKYSAGMRNISNDVYKERRDKYLKLMGLENFRTRLAGQLSGGMKQKLALCCVLVFQPKILLLDEPTTGVDPISRREFWDILTELSSENVTIIVATPYLDEAERCSRIALIYDGQFQQIGTSRELKGSLGLYRFEVLTEHIKEAENILLEASYQDNSTIKDVQSFGDRLDVLVKDSEEGKSELTAVLEANNLTFNKIKQAEITLENVFVLKLCEKSSISSSQSLPNLFQSQFPVYKNENNQKKIAIGAYELNKFFDSFQAVKNLNLEVKYGEIYGLLGANGAGKTTTIKMLCGLLDATSGEICLAGQYEELRSASVRQKIGYMSQKFTLYDDLTILENLKFYCGVYSVPLESQDSKIQWVLETSGLSGQENLLTAELPGGWKQRVSFGASVMHEPEILFLDEPTSGVDPLARRQFWKLIQDFALHGTAIVVTTHYLEEAEHCNRIAFMSGGEIIAEGTPDNIKTEQPGVLLEITVDNPQNANFVLKKAIEPWRVSLFGDKLHIMIDNQEINTPEIYSILNENQIKVFSADKIPFSLEDSFISIIERAKLEAGRE
ncbi:MAG: ATP-binding cassette domain-containing protein [bacterium]